MGNPHEIYEDDWYEETESLIQYMRDELERDQALRDDDQLIYDTGWPD